MYTCRIRSLPGQAMSVHQGRSLAKLLRTSASHQFVATEALRCSRLSSCQTRNARKSEAKVSEVLVSVRRCLLVPAKGSSIRHTSFCLWFREGLADALAEWQTQNATQARLSNLPVACKRQGESMASVVEKAQLVQDNGTVNALTTRSPSQQKQECDLL